jgi:hypothetical protein
VTPGTAVVILLILAAIASHMRDPGMLPAILFASAAAVAVGARYYRKRYSAVQRDPIESPQPASPLSQDRRNGTLMRATPPSWRRWAGYSAMKRMVTRSLEVTLGVVYLVVVAPLLVLIAVAIKLESPGPVLCRQPRVKMDGAAVQMVRFRCHAAGATEQIHLTVVGRILRRFKLDEIPMLLNVVWGDVSLNEVMRFGKLQILGPPEGYERAVWIVLLAYRIAVRAGGDTEKMSGMEHSPTSATGTGWERTPWHATQRAAWEALSR